MSAKVCNTQIAQLGQSGDVISSIGEKHNVALVPDRVINHQLIRCIHGEDVLRQVETRYTCKGC